MLTVDGSDPTRCSAAGSSRRRQSFTATKSTCPADVAMAEVVADDGSIRCAAAAPVEHVERRAAACGEHAGVAGIRPLGDGPSVDAVGGRRPGRPADGLLPHRELERRMAPGRDDALDLSEAHRILTAALAAAERCPGPPERRRRAIRALEAVGEPPRVSARCVPDGRVGRRRAVRHVATSSPPRASHANTWPARRRAPSGMREEVPDEGRTVPPTGASTR